MFITHVRTAAIMIVLFTGITGLAYPLVVTGLAQMLFPGKANGSMIVRDGKVRGSELIGQPFSSPRYFWGRLSATAPYAFNGGASTGSNYGPLHPGLYDTVKKRIDDLQMADPLNSQSVPIDLATSSSSGLDPHISIASALYQIPRVARARDIAEKTVRMVVDRNTQQRQLGILGEPTVNVLMLNLDLDETQAKNGEM